MRQLENLGEIQRIEVSASDIDKCHRKGSKEYKENTSRISNVCPFNKEWRSGEATKEK